MKILSARQIRILDQYTIENEPIASIDLMERAARKCFERITEIFPKLKNVAIFCGTGNNGGDGLVIARLMAQKNINISVYIVKCSPRYSPDFSVNLERLQATDVKIQYIENEEFDIDLTPFDIIIDAIFGSGLSRPVEGFTAKVIHHINQSKKTVISIDFPSGLFDEDNSSNNPHHIVKATLTLSFQVPKLSFFFPENAPYVGKFEIIDIGLSQEKLNQINTPYYLTDEDDIVEILKTRSPFAHKGNFGHALLIGGSYGMMGAMVLATKACLKSGAGKVSVLIPQCGYEIMQISAPEAMCKTAENKQYIVNHKIDYENYNAFGVGCGMATKEETQRFLRNFIQNVNIPVVFDADALNIISKHKTWLNFLPPQSILTPHKKEFERLFEPTPNTYQAIQLLRKKAVQHQIYILLKGRYSAIATPKGNVFFNPTGNPGMATGGSGDVLTGLITGLLAQQYHPFEACILGAYIHGLAGDSAITTESYETLTASSIVKHLKMALTYLHEKKSQFFIKS